MEKESWVKQLKKYKYEMIFAILILLVASYANSMAGHYVDKKVTQPVPDLILDHVPSIDLSYLYFLYAVIIAILIVYPIVSKLNFAAFAICQFALLVVIRGLFISMTHIGPSPEAIQVTWPIQALQNIDFNNDLFFSGHVAVSFLGFLLYRKVNRKLGLFFLVCSFVMAFTVLVMHLHYSIDVFAAFFMSYGSYKIGKVIFKKIDRY